MNISMPPVVILAGGLGTRLGHLTQRRPKCLVEVLGEPFAAHQLRLLRSQGVNRVFFCLGHLGDQVVEALGDGQKFGLEISYLFDGPRLLGTGGAIRRSLEILPESFFVTYGDSYLPCDLPSIHETFKTSQQEALMTVFANQGKWDSSNVEFHKGKILRYDKFHQTPRMNHIDYGLGLFNRRAFTEIPENIPFDLAHLYHTLRDCGRLAAFEVQDRFYEVGSSLGLEETRRYLDMRR